MKIKMKYNPYKIESSIFIDEIDIMGHDQSLSHWKNDRLQVWVESLIPILVNDILNEDEFEIHFIGTNHDYEDLVEVTDRNNNKNEWNISLTHEEAKDPTGKIDELIQLVEYMRNGPFEELKSEKIKENFSKALDSNFEISVIATMSSGKSTLINALLGQDLMPAKNEACTATISRIKNCDEMDYFNATCFDGAGTVIQSKENVTSEDLKEYNDNKNVSLINMEGPIPNINTGKMNLILIDTPGPNNSRDESHKDHTYRVIKHESKPLVLYVLNGTQLHTDDDRHLLSTLADQMKVGGKQSKDRFLFAINKVDEFDPDKESVGDMISNVESYLQDHGIERPNIFPTSAELAKIIRVHQNGVSLTRKQQNTLQEYKLFNGNEKMHLNQYNRLSPLYSQGITEKIQHFRDSADEINEALYHSGVPAIEAAINEYLIKYAFTSKISNAVDSFSKVIEEQQMKQELVLELKSNKETQQKVYEQMERISQEIGKGEKAKNLKTKITNLDINISEKIELVQGKIETILTEISEDFNNNEITRMDANKKIAKCKETVLELQSDILTDLEVIIESSIKKSAENLLSEYMSYVEEIIDANEVKGIKINKMKLITSAIPNGSDLIENSIYTTQEVVDTYMVKNESKKWYNPFSWFSASEVEKKIYGDVEYVNGVSLAEDFIAPIRQSLHSNVKEAIKHFEQEKVSVKKYFIAELESLDKIIISKVNEIKNLSNSATDLEKIIKENEEKNNWLDNLVFRLNKILEV
jgi:predicted GTPase